MREEEQDDFALWRTVFGRPSYTMATVGVPGLEGLDNNTTVVSSGGEAFEWMSFDQRKLYTNAFIVQDGKVCVLCIRVQADITLRFLDLAGL